VKAERAWIESTGASWVDPVIYGLENRVVIRYEGPRGLEAAIQGALRQSRLARGAMGGPWALTPPAQLRPDSMGMCGFYATGSRCALPWHT
jgi:hypothetical protein